jgi:hypothetical protein
MISPEIQLKTFNEMKTIYVIDNIIECYNAFVPVLPEC